MNITEQVNAFKQKSLVQKIKIIFAVLIVPICAYAVYTKSGIVESPEEEVVAFGEPLQATNVDVSTVNNVNMDNNASTGAQMPQTPKFREPEKIKVPQFNVVVELAKLIENVRNKPEALMDIQMSQAQKTMEGRAKLAEFMAQEQKAQLEFRQAQSQLNDLNAGVSTKQQEIPKNEDVDPFNANKLLQVNYNTMDFQLSNVRNSFSGYQALIAYKGTFYRVSEGEYVVPKVKVEKISQKKVVLSAPTIGSFEVAMKL